MINDCIVVQLNSSIKQQAIQLRRTYKIKLPDAIVAATSIYLKMSLIKGDKDFSKIDEISLVKYVK